jgi:hypothetical protein
MATARQASKKPNNEIAADQQPIVEEKVTKSNGDSTVRQYAKGRFLGKVLSLSISIGRVCEVL